jgi:hypothetical protein
MKKDLRWIFSAISGPSIEAHVRRSLTKKSSAVGGPSQTISPLKPIALATVALTRPFHRGGRLQRIEAGATTRKSRA